MLPSGAAPSVPLFHRHQFQKYNVNQMDLLKQKFGFPPNQVYNLQNILGIEMPIDAAISFHLESLDVPALAVSWDTFGCRITLTGSGNF